MAEGSVLGIRWTIGDVSDAGFEALRLSIQGALRLFGPAAEYVVCVNTLSPGEAMRRCGWVPGRVLWRQVTRLLPSWLAAHLDHGFAQGAAWKLIPLQVFPHRHELALDNDVILWDVPLAVSRWLSESRSCLVAEDVQAAFGQFAAFCEPYPRNLGIRGLPPGFDLARHMQRVLERARGPLGSELDEQGLQLAALQSAGPVHVVPIDEVSICSPFPPHLPGLGRSGAHFCGLNARSLGWSFEGRPAETYVQAHWQRQRLEVAARVAADPMCSVTSTLGAG